MILLFSALRFLNISSDFAEFSQRIQDAGLKLKASKCHFVQPKVCYLGNYGGPVGRGYEQRFESKNAYEQRSESKIAYGSRAKLRTVREQNCVRSESKIAYGPRAKLRTV